MHVDITVYWNETGGTRNAILGVWQWGSYIHNFLYVSVVQISGSGPISDPAGQSQVDAMSQQLAQVNTRVDICGCRGLRLRGIFRQFMYDQLLEDAASIHIFRSQLH